MLIDTLSTSFRVIGLTGGNNYKFKIRAKNIYGTGDFSDELTVEASDRPDKPNIPVVGLAGNQVSITWNLPDDHSNAITEYDI